jgi:hypothetical protein
MWLSELHGRFQVRHRLVGNTRVIAISPGGSNIEGGTWVSVIAVVPDGFPVRQEEAPKSPLYAGGDKNRDSDWVDVPQKPLPQTVFVELRDKPPQP